MIIPGMESLDPTLYSVLQSLYENNGRKSWNMYPENNGSICLKIRFNGRGVGSSESSIKQKPDSKIKRNFSRAGNWKKTSIDICEPKPAKRNRSDMSSVICDSSEKVENLRNCTRICDDRIELNLDQDLSSVDCTPIKTTPDSPLSVDDTVPITACDDLQLCDESETESFKECSFHDTELEISESKCDTPSQFDPYDNDNESVYDENEQLPEWRKVTRPCIQAGCFYRPNQNIEEHEVNQQLGPRPNGTFKTFWKCVRCGRVMCNECVYNKKRHLNRECDPDPINIENIITGFF